MADRFRDYDVLAKRGSPSWDAPTRAVVDARVALHERGGVLTPDQRATLRVVADRIVPQPVGRAPVNTVAILLGQIADDAGDGYRPASLPPLAAAWARGLDGIDAEARARHGRGAARLDGTTLGALLGAVARGTVQAEWPNIDPALFWKWRLIPDLVAAYYAHPSAWSAMGFGGPASPRGYVRLAADRRDPWEAAEE